MHSFKPTQIVPILFFLGLSAPSGFAESPTQTLENLDSKLTVANFLHTHPDCAQTIFQNKQSQIALFSGLYLKKISGTSKEHSEDLFFEGLPNLKSRQHIRYELDLEFADHQQTGNVQSTFSIQCEEKRD